MVRSTKKASPAQTVLAKKAATLKATTAVPALNPTLAEANVEHQVEAGLVATTPSHKHDRERVHAARAPPRAPRTKTAQAERFVGLPPAVFTISTFCTSHGISEAFFFKLRKKGLAPRELRIGTRVLITFESAAKWRATMEKTTAAKAAAE